MFIKSAFCTGKPAPHLVPGAVQFGEGVGELRSHAGDLRQAARDPLDHRLLGRAAEALLEAFMAHDEQEELAIAAERSALRLFDRPLLITSSL